VNVVAILHLEQSRFQPAIVCKTRVLLIASTTVRFIGVAILWVPIASARVVRSTVLRGGGGASSALIAPAGLARAAIGVPGEGFNSGCRSAWALLSLIEAGEVGVAPFERPAPRWSLYVSIFRQKGLAIETVLERHGGPYAGRRGRYVLRCPIKIIDRKDAP